MCSILADLPRDSLSQLEALFSIASQVFDAVPVMWSWHIARIPSGHGEALGDAGLRIIPSSQIQKKQRTQL